MKFISKSVIAGILCVFATAAVAQESDTYAWVQLGTGGNASVRAITSDDCAKLSTDVSFTPRPNNGMTQMSNLNVCEASVPLGSQTVSVTVGGKTLTLPKQAPKRVVVIGDTGCRISHNRQKSECDPDKWIFAQVAEAVIQSQPGLILDVGDYVYRFNCWDGDEGCEHHEDALESWPIWQADFFDPAQNLLAAAPWVFTRGNHEDSGYKTNRGWRGWSLFLSPNAPQSHRADVSRPEAPYFVTLPNVYGDLSIYVVDSSDEATPGQNSFAALEKQSSPVWLMTHVPLWSQDDKFGYTLPTHVSMVISGHVHNFELIQAKQGYPAQIVQGASGTRLDQFRGSGFAFETGNGKKNSFTIIDRVGESWGTDVTLTLCTVTYSAESTPAGNHTVKTEGKWAVKNSGVWTITPVTFPSGDDTCAKGPT